MSERDPSTAPRQLVSFRLGEEEYGVDILCVQEIIRVGHITPIPNAPDFVEGVLNLRGRVIPVIALRKRLGLPAAGQSKETRIVVVDLPPNTLGFMVDAVSEVIRVPGEKIEPPPRAGGSGCTEAYVEGVAKLDDRLLMILHPGRLLSEEQSDSLAA